MYKATLVFAEALYADLLRRIPKLTRVWNKMT